ncbi:hypothetical protein H0H87_006006, partial [Tephrocybe sp. NHM501043]
ELQMDAARQQRVQANVALIEARDREERAQVLRLQQDQAALSLQHPQQGAATATSPKDTQRTPGESLQRSAALDKNPLSKMATKGDAYEPEPWTPQTVTRRR